jgi:hypothetical protein
VSAEQLRAGDSLDGSQGGDDVVIELIIVAAVTVGSALPSTVMKPRLFHLIDVSGHLQT